MTRFGSSRDNVDNAQTPTGGSSANQITINLGGSTLVVVVLLVTVIGACGVVMGMNLSAQAALEREFHRDTEATNKAVELMQRQSRMTELKLDDWTVTAHRAGLILSGDYTRGPQGNPDAEAYHVPQPKDQSAKRSKGHP